jgi:hypothetical protein
MTNFCSAATVLVSITCSFICVIESPSSLSLTPAPPHPHYLLYISMCRILVVTCASKKLQKHMQEGLILSSNNLLSGPRLPISVQRCPIPNNFILAFRPTDSIP